MVAPLARIGITKSKRIAILAGKILKENGYGKELENGHSPID
jgi:hypothetical protein